MTERWKPIKGFDGKYEVSDLGRVRVTCDTPNKRAGDMLAIDCKNSRCYVNLFYQNKQYSMRVDELVIKAFVKANVKRANIKHRDGDTTNNQLTNLHYQKNTAQMQLSMPTKPAPELPEQPKPVQFKELTTRDAFWIREDYQSKRRETVRELAARYGTDEYTIHLILTDQILVN